MFVEHGVASSASWKEGVAAIKDGKRVKCRVGDVDAPLKVKILNPTMEV